MLANFFNFFINILTFKYRHLAEYLIYLELIYELIQGFVPFDRGIDADFFLLISFTNLFSCYSCHMGRDALITFVVMSIKIYSYPYVLNEDYTVVMVITKLW